MKKALFLVACTLIFAACHNHSQEHEHEHGHESHEHETHNEHNENGEIVISPSAATSLGIKVQEIKRKDFSCVIATSGAIIEATSGEIAIVAKGSGIISWKNNKQLPGTRIQTGEEIATISSKGFVQGNSAAEAQNRFELAKVEYDRALALKEKKIISEKEFIKIENEYKNAENAINDLSAEGLKVKSPANAQIKEILKTEGEGVNEGETIAILLKSEKAILKADLPQSKIGTKIIDADFKLAHSDKVYNIKQLGGQLRSIGAKLEGAFLPYYFEFENKDQIPQGSYVQSYLISSIKTGTISVPLSALIEEQASFFVYIQLDEECYEKRAVKLGEKNSSEVEILSGIGEGERVVIEGAFQVKLSKAAVIPGHTHNH